MCFLELPPFSPALASGLFFGRRLREALTVDIGL